MSFTPTVNYKSTSSTFFAKKWLDDLPDFIACDFETANKTSEEEKHILRARQSLTGDRDTFLSLDQQIDADGLSHPSLTCITHLSVAWSTEDAFVLIADTEAMRRLIFNWLVTTTRHQIWHNVGFDFKHIHYHTGKIPINYDDTQLLAKTLLNHTDNFKSRSGLKELMGWKYGDWAINKKEFTLANLFDPEMIKYAAIDALATYGLLETIKGDLNE